MAIHGSGFRSPHAGKAVCPLPARKNPDMCRDFFSEGGDRTHDQEINSLLLYR